MKFPIQDGSELFWPTRAWGSFPGTNGIVTKIELTAFTGISKDYFNDLKLLFNLAT